jgi:hypothetical protein
MYEVLAAVNVKITWYVIRLVDMLLRAVGTVNQATQPRSSNEYNDNDFLAVYFYYNAFVVTALRFILFVGYILKRISSVIEIT